MAKRLKRSRGRVDLAQLSRRVGPAQNYGDESCEFTNGSHHIRYVSPGMVLRPTTDASITAIQDLPFILEGELTLVFSPDETIHEAPHELARRFKDDTLAHWHSWVRNLGIPFEWQDDVIRAAITLKLNTFDDTGAIVPAITASIPESPNSGRNWDYRYCWIRRWKLSDPEVRGTRGRCHGV